MSFKMIQTAWKIQGLARIWSLRQMAVHLLLVSLLAAYGSVWATLSECEKALVDIQAKLGDTVKSESYLEVFDVDAEKPTVTLRASSPGHYGGRRLLLERTGARWASSYRSLKFDPQGDPRWFIEVVGAEAAEFFGFKVISDTQVTVPDAVEFTGALGRLNVQLKAMGHEPVPITYYVTDTNENTKVAEYIQSFGDRGSLPLAPSGNHLIHDLSFHTGAIFFPPKLVEFKTYYSRYLTGFIDFLAAKYAKDSAKFVAVKYFSYLLRMNETVNLDTATGLVNPGIVASLRDMKSDGSREVLYAPVALMSARGSSAIDHLARQIEALSPWEEGFVDEYNFGKRDKVSDLLKSLSVAELLEDLTEFNSTSPRIAGREMWGSIFIPQDDKVLEDLCKGIGQRRLIIREAALTIIQTLN